MSVRRPALYRNPCYSAPHWRTDIHAQKGTRLGSRCWPLLLLAAPAAAQPLAEASADDVAHGKRVFDIHCSRCHGLDGVGGEGPNLMRENLRRSTRRRRAARDRGRRHRGHRHAGPRVAEHQGNPKRRRLRPVAGGGSPRRPPGRPGGGPGALRHDALLYLPHRKRGRVRAGAGSLRRRPAARKCLPAGVHPGSTEGS